METEHTAESYRSLIGREFEYQSPWKTSPSRGLLARVGQDAAGIWFEFDLAPGVSIGIPPSSCRLIYFIVS